MSPFSQTIPRVAVTAGLGVAAVFACGPFFGIEVLPDRKQVLLAPPTISFETELKALVPAPRDKLPVVESSGYGQDQENRATLEARELTPTALARVTEMWKQSGGEAAYDMGKELPPAIRLYTAGAVSFFHGQTETARTYFQSILSLSSHDRKSRELWAHFMLGRVALQQRNQPEAAAQFEAVRTLVQQGMPDELGLAVASFGEQARGAWRQGAIANAVDLYARQAAYASQSGANSLVMMAGLILNDRNLLDQAVQDPRTLRLLFIALNGNSGRPFFVHAEPDRDTGSKLDGLVAALERHGLNRVEGAGLLASAAYSQGRFDLAQKLAALEDVPMSAWVMAKLALRRGDRESALKEYEQALKTFQPAIGDPTGMRMELAVLKVSREDYVQALDLFYGAAAKGWDPTSQWSGFADYWGDAAYLAERVLTIEELRDYVDHKLPSSSDPTSGRNSERSRLRSILARRLMRAGRRREALSYFDDRKIRSAAEQYANALDKAMSWWRVRLTRAESWFAAATLARNSGMEILGFEKEPDFAIWEGEYAPFDVSDDAKSPAGNQPKPADPYQAEGERKRAAASKPERDVRFQYRLTAADHAMKSADLLPARSQAFAAVLCEATRWAIDRQPKRAKQIYQRYLHHGAYVSWGRSFGKTCPPPNFAAASSWSTASLQINHLARHARAHRVSAGLLAFSVVTMLAVLLYYVRARRLGRPLNS